MITANDYQLGLYNGETGFVIDCRAGTASAGGALRIGTETAATAAVVLPAASNSWRW